MTLFEKAQVVGTFLGFSESGLEFHADLILPYQNYFQSSPAGDMSLPCEEIVVIRPRIASASLSRATSTNWPCMGEDWK